MDLLLDITKTIDYKNNSQIARVLTEDWVQRNSYCPNCGEPLSKFENNRPVADFFCTKCKEEFELKSKNSTKIGTKITDGAYSKMIERIQSANNPNFFFLTYDKTNMKVFNFLIIPNYFFVPNIIKKRKPLSHNARRAGWVGCNIDLTQIPETGRIFYVKNSIILSKEKVVDIWKKTEFLKNKNSESKGWIIDIINCVEKIDKEIFQLKDVYKFETQLQIKYSNNNFIKDKIRQQLQLLRDKGFIEFLGRGKYRKLWKI